MAETEEIEHLRAEVARLNQVIMEAAIIANGIHKRTDDFVVGYKAIEIVDMCKKALGEKQ